MKKPFHLYPIYKDKLTRANSHEDFLRIFSELNQYYVNDSENGLRSYTRNRKIHILKSKLFPLYVNNFKLTGKYNFIHKVFMILKPFFKNIEDEFYLHRYFENHGKVGINNLGLYAFDYIKYQINHDQPIDYSIFLYSFQSKYQLTTFVIDHLYEYIFILNDEMEKSEVQTGVPLLMHYYIEYNQEYINPKVKDFKRSKRYYYLYLEQEIKSVLRRSENILRNREGLPNIGEGYVNEVLLLNKIKEIFKKCRVEHHYRPQWLNGMELDIYIEKYKIGIEYQGEQHRRPIEYFGGRDAFEKQVARDFKKLQLCEANGIELFHCYHDEPMDLFVNSLNDFIKTHRR